MGGPYRSTPLILLLLLLFLSVFVNVSATRPGFLYTRTTPRCTPKYWSSRKEAWPKMVPQTSTVSKVFGSRARERFRSDLTLLEATARSDRGDAFRGLLKQASASLLNSYARKGFPYAPWAVKTLVIKALVSEEAAALQAQHFYIANEGCN
ncbi:pollen Ole e I family allergen protein [Parasponia andersonii]|uniref:Pollen Ole e I family allergen protein n=1 Tax=Parasponia andersonii TaxID=3476 RepID=A0A2P5CNK4_PARAD|nr:pollen Ole e I family allergen protein [Parasponia andersonii]